MAPPTLSPVAAPQHGYSFQVSSDAPLLQTALGLPRGLALLQHTHPTPTPQFWEKPVAKFPMLWALFFVL